MVDADHTPLRTAWTLPVDPRDVWGTGEGAAQWALPASLSDAFDEVRDHLGTPRLAPDGTPPLLPPGAREVILEEAQASVEEPWPRPLLSLYARYWRSGVRFDYEIEVRNLGMVTAQAALAALATGEEQWIDRAADGLLQMCELSTWCWVAHEEVNRRRGWVVPDPESAVVDLGAAQVVEVLAWADLALAPALEARVPGLRERIRYEFRRRVVDPVLARRDWWWVARPSVNNWTGWIHQHLIAGSLLLLDREEDRAARDAMLALAIAQQERYLVSLPTDGGIDEGFNYFWNGASRLLESIELLFTASGGVLSPETTAKIPVLGALARYPHRMELGEGWYVNVADGPARPGAAQPWDAMHRWGRLLGDAEVVAGALAHRGTEDAPPLDVSAGLGRVLGALGDPEWIASRQEPAPMPASSWLPEVGLWVARERSGTSDGLALAAKGGHNDESHNHLDVGSVMVALDASPVLIDLGQPTYLAHTFSERRYEIWTMVSSWHTLPTIAGHEQGVGEQYRAEVLAAPTLTGGTEEFVLELAGAYPGEAGVRSWRRRTVLDRAQNPVGPDAGADGAVVEIEDRWELDPRVAADGGAVRAHHVLAGDVLEHVPGRLCLRALSGTLAQLEWDPAVGEGELERREVEDPLLQASWGDVVHRLTLAPPTAADGSGAFTLRLSAAG